ncbi:hypothetical protein L4D06_10670 [Enterovibrio makurazakiensis]|uniref:DUF4760 domain-containing protein n=1 Tax=Enterovibrio gelatinilyticus TaxID=2899819 RepID=A0ABT5R4V4_9GAMM|nr:hypothetical protein [Enterovibrio sp. ZSDZ42]MDD1794875.1 hypothetical protein [Enterovibrio sp. ZSDZ42]
MPDFIATSKWRARLVISLAFLVFSAITIASCVYFGLTQDAFFIAALSVTLLVYLVSMPMLTNTFVESDRVKSRVAQSKNTYLIKSLSNTPLEERLQIANHIWKSLRSEEWTTCVSYAHTADKPRTTYCCQQIGKIASDLIHNDPEIFSDAMLKTMNNQRGSASYFFDILVMLGEQQFHEEHEEQRKVRGTKKLLLDDLFTHR